ncbi:uncharacterized protein [Medicago truncatula]|uniref:uncharacterized protein n=1 Tax=Medicago truncatula TaxID=3880 RepID=UPI0019688F52|nr:uncharacterized protein LOC25501134 [Medicago truncatula]
MPTSSSQHSVINQPSVVKGPGNAVEQQTNISLQGIGVSNNAPRISETEAFGAHTNTQRISPLIEESNNHNQVCQKPTLGSEEQSPQMQRLIKAMTTISPQALGAAVGDIEKVVRMNDEIPTFISPEGWKMRPVFDPTTFDTPTVSASMFNGFNQFNDAVESDLNSPEALRAAFGDIEEVVRLNDEIQPFISPVGGVSEGWNMCRVFDPTAFGSPSVSASMFNGFTQFNDAVESDLNSPEALRAEFGNIEEVVRLNDEIQPFISPVGGVSEGWKMRRVFDPTPFDTPSVSASMCNGFNQFTDAAESDMNSLTKRRKCSQPVEIQNVLAEIKDINNRLFDCEVVIAEKENVESVVGLASEHAGGLLVKIMYNAVTINQNLVSHFTSDKKSLINPLRLLIPASYPSSSLIFLDELPLQDSEDFRDLFERAKGKLSVNLESMKQPWLIKDVARAWEGCAREAILEYAHANGGGTFTSMYGGWEFC